MRSSTILLTATGLATTAFAGLGDSPIAVADVIARANEERAANSDCQSSAIAILTEIPYPSSSLLSWLAASGQALATATDVCATAVPTNLPSSLSSDWAAYISSASSWYMASSSEFASLSSACTGITALNTVWAATSQLSACYNSGSGSGSVTKTSGSATPTVVATTSGGSTFSVTQTPSASATAKPAAAAGISPKGVEAVLMAAGAAIGAAAFL